MDEEQLSILGLVILIVMDVYLIYRLYHAQNNRHRNALLILFIVVNVLGSIVLYLNF